MVLLCLMKLSFFVVSLGPVVVNIADVGPSR